MTKRFEGALYGLASCVALFVMTSLYGCHANDVPADWKADCVGRMQLSFPSDVEVAANTANMLEREYKLGSLQPSFDFADGQHAGWSELNYLGRLYASHPLSASERNRLAAAANQLVLQAQNAARNKKDKTGKPLIFEELTVAPQKGVASRVDADYDVSLFVGESMIWLSASGIDTKWDELRKSFEIFVNGAIPRMVGEVPSMPGVCLPYAFVKDNNRPWRHIAMTYRLREHPDITIMLRDQNAVEIDPKANPAVYDPESISDSFWSRYDNMYRKSLRGVWNSPYRRAKLGNSKGLESFVKIVRKDDTVDYGYLVVTKGDPAAKEDTPDLMLYVVQDSKNAKAKGIAPMEKEAFLSMAQTIAASVKRRPTSP